MQSHTFSGHETFHCRPLWLKKGIDFIAKDFSFTEDSAVVELGVGRNMVAAIRAEHLKRISHVSQNKSSKLLDILDYDEEEGCAACFI